MQEKMQEQWRKPTLIEAIIVMLMCAGIIAYGVFVLEASVHMPIISCAIVAALWGFIALRIPWEKIEEGMITGITMALQAIVILMMVGLIIGIWIKSGSVPSMIYYGLDILSPKYFLVAAFLICSIVSLATGTSWGTSGTVGIAMMGIGAGLGVPAAMTAGIVISGAYFGDKMSPLSDTTNLAPAIAGTDLFSHIRAMMWTTGPTYVIVLGIAFFLGLQYGSGQLDAAKITAIQTLMTKEFSISLMGLIPPLLVIVMAAAKIPALPGLFAGVIVAALMAATQGAGLGDIYGALMDGYAADLSQKFADAADAASVTALMAEQGITTGAADIYQEAGKMIAKLVSRGGMQSMMWTISLILCALSFGGIMERCGFLDTILEAVLKFVTSVGGLVTAVIVSCLVCNIFLGDQYLSIVMPGRMFKGAFEKKQLHPRMLSRSLEDAGTLVSVLIPWNTCGAYHQQVLGVPTLEYLPYAFLNYLNPLVAITLSYLGIGVFYGKQGEPLRKTPEPEPAR